MLASRRAGRSDQKYVWHFLYYIYIGLPLLVLYWFLYMYFWYMVVGMLYDVLGLARFRRNSWLHWSLSVGLSLGFTVALFHFNLLPYIFAPVKLITSI